MQRYNIIVGCGMGGKLFYYHNNIKLKVLFKLRVESKW